MEFSLLSALPPSASTPSPSSSWPLIVHNKPWRRQVQLPQAKEATRLWSFSPHCSAAACGLLVAFIIADTADVRTIREHPQLRFNYELSQKPKDKKKGDKYAYCIEDCAR